MAYGKYESNLELMNGYKTRIKSISTEIEAQFMLLPNDTLLKLYLDECLLVAESNDISILENKLNHLEQLNQTLVNSYDLQKLITDRIKNKDHWTTSPDYKPICNDHVLEIRFLRIPPHDRNNDNLTACLNIPVFRIPFVIPPGIELPPFSIRNNRCK